MYIFPLIQKDLILDCAGHIAGGRGCAEDFHAFYERGVAPDDGVTFNFNEPRGGNWLRITFDNGYRVEFAHLSQRLVPSGSHVTRGQVVMVTGNSGTWPNGTNYLPHLHRQVFNPQGQRIDPKLFFKGEIMPTTNQYEEFENLALIQNPGGEKGFFKGGKLHKFSNQVLASGFEHYSFMKTSKFIDAGTYNTMPKGTLSAEEVLKGKRDW